MERNYWQVAAGSDAMGHSYEEYFLRYGLAFVGDPAHRTSISNVQAGDVLILKQGLTQIVTAGVAVEGWSCLYFSPSAGPSSN